MGVIFGSSAAPSSAPVQWTGFDMRWTGADGSKWNLTNASDGTVMMPGVRGLSMPPVVHHRAAHASVPGARWRGLHVDVREVFWPLQVYTGDGSAAWLEKDRAFWRSLDPVKTGTWTVIQPDGTRRSLKLRFVDDGEAAFGHDPVQGGWNSYGITLAAEQPFWEADEIKKSWESGNTPVDFFGPPFTITGGGTLTEAKLENPGDVDAHVVWRVYGPCTSASVGINGKTITVPFAIDAGKYVRIDTNPTAQTAWLSDGNGNLTVDKTGSLTGITFAPLPGKATSDLSLTMAGTGKITATFTPRYYRAW